jgi:DNA-binding PadR family transcriptional regulator
MLEELRRHDCRVSAETLYPILDRMEQGGSPRSEREPGGGARARRDYHLTEGGSRVLGLVPRRLEALPGELADHDR